MFQCRVVTDRETGCFPQPGEADAPALLCCLAWQAGRTGGRDEGVIGGLMRVSSSVAAGVSCVFYLSTVQSYSSDLTQGSTTKLI